VEAAKAQYRAGTIGDVECKKRLIDVLVALIEPFYQRRQVFEKDPGQVLDVLRQGTEKANAVANQTLLLAKKAMQQHYF
jgi:tryptophanyl-tRNA synthetase